MTTSIYRGALKRERNGPDLSVSAYTDGAEQFAVLRVDSDGSYLTVHLTIKEVDRLALLFSAAGLAAINAEAAQIAEQVTA